MKSDYTYERWIAKVMDNIGICIAGICCAIFIVPFIVLGKIIQYIPYPIYRVIKYISWAIKEWR